ncbi:MAG: beta-glucosidase [Anaerolineaceae bacterium]|nr:beta-glucosidase [Anaerolineaceae bacterium]
MSSSIMFPKDFVWGCATASYQIEGAVKEDGRGASIWDIFSHTPGKIMNSDTGDAACDHYHHYPEDIQLMKTLGLKAYRFSIAWPRIIPDGNGQINESGIAFYDSLVDKLLEAGITPYPTLYHWDMPQALDEKGGWLNRESADWFANYTDVITRALGDRVKNWMTFNEPYCIAYLSYHEGVHAPGHKHVSYREANQALHHFYLAHGKAIPIIHANSSASKAGIVLSLSPVHAVTDSEADKAAAVRVDGKTNRWLADPLFKGAYPADRLALLGADGPDIQAGDMEIISTPMDFLGVNYYFRTVVGDDPNSPFVEKARYVDLPDVPRTDMGWEIYPEGLREILTWVQQEYNPPEIYMTENGCAVPDEVTAEGVVHDPPRSAYLKAHVAAAAAAVEQGACLKGYFAWSLLDNFEWAFGYDRRFGITYVDYPTQKRTPKDSFYTYQAIIRNNGLVE